MQATTSSPRELLHRIGSDVKTIARDEIELAKAEMEAVTRKAAGEGAGVVLGGVVALIGLGMLCASVVAALAPVIPPLSLRLLIMAAIYLLLGSIVAATFATRFKDGAVPHLTVPAYEAKRTVNGVKDTLAHS